MAILRLLLDVDGCVNRFHQHVIDVLGLDLKVEDFKSYEISEKLEERERKQYFELLKTPEFWGTLPVLEEAVPIVRAARKAKDRLRVRWATSPWVSCREWGHMRYHWLNDKFDVPPDEVHITAAKEDIDADIFLDDKIDNVEAWQRAHPKGLAYLFKTPYNEKGGGAFRRVTWVEFADIISVRT
jgi:5'(3')-deoxyribonucleotidase